MNQKKLFAILISVIVIGATMQAGSNLLGNIVLAGEPTWPWDHQAFFVTYGLFMGLLFVLTFLDRNHYEINEAADDDNPSSLLKQAKTTLLNGKIGRQTLQMIRPSLERERL